MTEPSDPNGGWDRIGVGFGIAWAALAVSIVLGFVIAGVLDVARVHGNDQLLAGVIPPLLMLVMLIAAYASGKKRFASGVLAGFGSMFAITLLLVAACFGLFAVNGF